MDGDETVDCYLGDCHIGRNLMLFRSAGGGAVESHSGTAEMRIADEGN